MTTKKLGKYFIFNLILIIVVLNSIIFYWALGFELPDFLGGENFILRSNSVTFSSETNLGSYSPNYPISFMTIGIVFVILIVCYDYSLENRISRSSIKQMVKKLQNLRYREHKGYLILLSLAVILILDELWLLGIDIPTNRMLGDYSDFHIEPFHHFHFGIAILALFMSGYFYKKLRSLY